MIDKAAGSGGDIHAEDGDTSPRLDTTLGCVIDQLTAPDASHDTGLPDRAETALAKDRLAFFVDHEIARITHRQSRPEKIGFLTRSIEPERMDQDRRDKFSRDDESNKGIGRKILPGSDSGLTSLPASENPAPVSRTKARG